MLFIKLSLTISSWLVHFIDPAGLRIFYSRNLVLKKKKKKRENEFIQCWTAFLKIDIKVKELAVSYICIQGECFGNSLV